MSDEPLIWWTSEQDCKAITDDASTLRDDLAWPTYLVDEYESRLGRNGRGRLWVAQEFGKVAVEPWPDTPLAHRLGDDEFGSGGIVIRRADLPLVRNLPGIVTTIKLDRVA